MTGTFHIDERYREPLAVIGLRDFRSVMDSDAGITIGSHDDRNAVRLDIERDGRTQTLYLKRTLCYPIAAILKELFSGIWPQARPIREYQVADKLARLGIPAMKAIGCGQRKRFGLPHEAFVLVEEVPAKYMLDEAMRVSLNEDSLLNTRQRRDLIRSVARLVRQLHDAHLRWPDLVAKHIYLDLPSPDDTEYDWNLRLIDLERIYTSRSAKARAKNLKMLLKSMPRRSITRTDVLRFASTYASVDDQPWPKRRQTLEREFAWAVRLLR